MELCDNYGSSAHGILWFLCAAMLMAAALSGVLPGTITAPMSRS
jgi:hypothetical protein